MLPVLSGSLRNIKYIYLTCRMCTSCSLQLTLNVLTSYHCVQLLFGACTAIGQISEALYVEYHIAVVVEVQFVSLSSHDKGLNIRSRKCCINMCDKGLVSMVRDLLNPF
jgi:hypothetical protein